METTTNPTNSEVIQSDMMQTMRRKRGVLAISAAAILAIVWYLFRPELLFVDQTVSEAFPAATPTSMAQAMDSTTLLKGNFHAGAHETKGTASIHQLADGKRVLRLTGFETSNGPDVHVLLGRAADAADNEMVKDAGYIDLGSLKGNVGDQNYIVPDDVELDDYHSVTIWCNRFSVNFGTAPLSAEGDSMMPDMAKVLAMGSFHAGAHETKGSATVHELPNGKRVLRLTDFETSNGPDVHVLLGKAADASDNDTVKDAGYADLGSLKGNIGDQNYEIPADVDVSDYQSVTIWCNRFSVNFGTAPLKMN